MNAMELVDRDCCFFKPRDLARDFVSRSERAQRLQLSYVIELAQSRDSFSALAIFLEDLAHLLGFFDAGSS